MNLFWSVTRGDTLYREVPFVDQYGAPVNLANWGVFAGFKRLYSDRNNYFALTQDNDGLSFKNADASTGILCFTFDQDYADLDLSVLPRNGEFVPFKFLVGDLKLTPPDGIGLMPDGGGRVSIVLKVLAGVTP